MNTATAWRELISTLPRDFFYFFMPELARLVDFETAPRFLTSPTEVLNNSVAREQHNFLLELRSKDKGILHLLLCLELGGYDNRKFEQRLFRDLTLCMEGFDYDRPLASFTLFLASSIPASMNGYEYEQLGTTINMLYPSYAVREQYFDDLWALGSPMAFAVATARIAAEHSSLSTSRLEQKKEVVERLLQRHLQRGLSFEKMLVLLRFVTNILSLKTVQETQFQVDLIKFLYHQTDISDDRKLQLIAVMTGQK